MWLLFEMTLKPSNTLLEGTLTVREAGENPTHTFKVTSGLPKHQNSSDQAVSGKGPIPSCALVGLQSYAVGTIPRKRDHVVGIEGAFFPVSPVKVLVGTVERSAFGIHRDANVAGSAGCIVFRDENEWSEFQVLMKDYSLNFSHISLIVKYN
jgi:hypothetical protein